ncbi:hypothetical protein [Spirosoma rhododendri]|uniref:Uncharacterized protein n=1 Tax=Spirosoma rhododendri TaxID=2728024 RepID=A0A7L5DP99_9BACT|nr:hypothetical protein [Spirosoma rhododendri]QJD79043.1 hypothetical protein HH216_11875 [Spirosoma rhododendri]
MRKFLYFLETIDLMRMVLGICILVDGYPLIFFFRETLKLAPGSTVFTAAVFAVGLILMVPFTVLRRLYRPNMTMFWMGLGFITLCIAYMFTYLGDPGFRDYDKDMIYYAYALIFLFLLINIPNDIARVFILVVVLFTFVSNLGLIYSLITNPSWAIGQRATITLGDNDDGSGNPHVFSRNAFMGVVACAIWLIRSDTNILLRIFALFAGVINLAVLVLTQTRSSILALIIAITLFLAFNVRPPQIRAVVRGIFRPVTLGVVALGVVGIALFLRRYYDVYAVLYGYVLGFAERNLDNIYALVGAKAQGAAYKATLDDSAANRSVSALFFSNVVTGHIHMLILGFGYKYLYLDVPVLESLTNMGILGFFLFGGVNAMCLYYALGIMRTNPNQLSVFLAYFYMLIMVAAFTGGRPNEISFWIPLALMTRFMGIEHLFPEYLQEHRHIVYAPAVPATSPTN